MEAIGKHLYNEFVSDGSQGKSLFQVEAIGKHLYNEFVSDGSHR